MDKDRRFETAINERKDMKEARTMSEWLDRVINESETKGRLETLASLVKDKLITLTEAAKSAGMTTEEFSSETGINQIQ